MAASFLSAVGLATILALTVPSLAFAGDLHLIFNNGRVTLTARDVPLREILAEWERVGGTRVVNPGTAPGTSFTLELTDCPEARALEILLREEAGYFASERSAPSESSSRFTLIVIMPTTGTGTAVATQATAGAQESGTPPATQGQPQFQRRIRPDGRVLTPAGSPVQPSEAPAADDERGSEPPQEEPYVAVPGPPRFPTDLTGANPSQSSGPGVPGSANRTQSGTRATPTVGDTAPLPGTVIPAPKVVPPPYTPQEYPRQTAPPKPPGI